MEFTASKYTDMKLQMMQTAFDINLFEHQSKAVSDTYNSFMKWYLDGTVKYRKMIGVSPTGSGKTVMLFSIADLYLRLVGQKTGERGRLLILVHTKSLMHQVEETARERWGYSNIGLLGDETNTAKPHSDLVIAMVQSLGGDNKRIRNRRLAKMGHFSLVVVDECHKAVTDTHKNAIETFVVGKTALLGVTATYERSDSAPMSEVFTHTAFVVQPAQLLANNFIAKPHYHYPVRKNGAVRNSDVARGEKVMWSQYYNMWLKLDGENKKTIVFTETKKQAKAIHRFMKKRGHNSGYIVAETSTREREYVVNNCDVIINIYTMTEGTDIDGLEIAIMTRVSRINTLFYIQRAGRAMRAKWIDDVPVAKDCYIVAPRHHDLLATIPTNVIEVADAWLDRLTRELATYLPHEDQVAIEARLDEIMNDDLDITEEEMFKMPTPDDIREKHAKQEKKRKKNKKNRGRKAKPKKVRIHGKFNRLKKKQSNRVKVGAFFNALSTFF